MKEVEILIQLFEAKDEVFNQLKKFTYKGIKKILDIYFYHPNKDALKPNSDNTLNECFRLRNQNGKAYITYKINHFDNNNKWVYADEYEAEVSDFDAIIKIIDCLGFKPLVKIENEKNVFLTKQYEIILEDVKDLGLFLEVEKLNVSDNEDIIKIKKEIQNFIYSLGFKFKELNIGKPELMLRKNKNCINR
ncbi:MAG: class IV adenylate cyclase [Patescibacteria group bacterium]|nr:class IV adenylate cyclase [Patescibacteria group bacterium]